MELGEEKNGSRWTTLLNVSTKNKTDFSILLFKNFFNMEWQGLGHRVTSCNLASLCTADCRLSTPDYTFRLGQART